MITRYYTDTQVDGLLEDILNQIPNNDNKFTNLRKYIQHKRDTIYEHI